jgi:hypothetical protein
MNVGSDQHAASLGAASDITSGAGSLAQPRGDGGEHR